VTSPAASATLRLATRGSALARVQTELAAAALVAAGSAAVETVVITTRGDRDQSTPAAQMEGQGWFTSELEAAVRDGRADAAVHSAKDLPTILAPGLSVVAHLERADPRDALVSRHAGGLDGLPEGATVGTSSPRREAFLHALRPDLRTVEVRGNVDTRLRKLAGGEADALLLACAGLDRLGMGDRISERLDPRRVVPAPGQGAVAIEAVDGTPAAAVCSAADHGATTAAVRAERSLLAGLGGGCLLPIGAWARWEDGQLVVLAAIAGPDGVRTAELSGDGADPDALGAAVAARLLAVTR
jgi:hydroxymethylbilane synthase